MSYQWVPTKYFQIWPFIFHTRGILCGWEQLESVIWVAPAGHNSSFSHHGFWLQVVVSFAWHIWVITLSHAGRVTGQPILLVTWHSELAQECEVHTLLSEETCHSWSAHVGKFGKLISFTELHRGFQRWLVFPRIASASIAVGCEPQLQLPDLLSSNSSLKMVYLCLSRNSPANWSKGKSIFWGFPVGVSSRFSQHRLRWDTSTVAPTGAGALSSLASGLLGLALEAHRPKEQRQYSAAWQFEWGRWESQWCFLNGTMIGFATLWWRKWVSCEMWGIWCLTKNLPVDFFDGISIHLGLTQTWGSTGPQDWSFLIFIHTKMDVNSAQKLRPRWAVSSWLLVLWQTQLILVGSKATGCLLHASKIEANV